MSLCRNHDDQRMSFILFVLTEEHLLNVSPHSRQVAHMHPAWRSLIHVILWQNVSCLGRTQCASIPIQFRDRRRSLSCTTGPWSLWGLVEQMVSFSTSIWPSSPFFFLLFFSFPKGAPGGKCLRKMAVTARRCLIHFSQDMLFKSICSRWGGGELCSDASLVDARIYPRSSRLSMDSVFLNVHTDGGDIFSPQSVLLPVCQITHNPTSNISPCMAYKCKYTAHRTFPLDHGQTDGRWW